MKHSDQLTLSSILIKHAFVEPISWAAIGAALRAAQAPQGGRAEGAGRGAVEGLASYGGTGVGGTLGMVGGGVGGGGVGAAAGGMLGLLAAALAKRKGLGGNVSRGLENLFSHVDGPLAKNVPKTFANMGLLGARAGGAIGMTGGMVGGSLVGGVKGWDTGDDMAKKWMGAPSWQQKSQQP